MREIARNRKVFVKARKNKPSSKGLRIGKGAITTEVYFFGIVYKILAFIIDKTLISFRAKKKEGHQDGFKLNRSTTDEISVLPLILGRCKFYIYIYIYLVRRTKWKEVFRLM